jgi:hypothetical protein
MSLIVYKPYLETVVVSSSTLTGVSGATGRQFTMGNVPAVVVSIVLMQGSPLTATADYTVLGQVITFVGPVDDGMILQVAYSISQLIPDNAYTTTSSFYTTPELVQSEIRASAAFGSTTTPTLDDVNTWISQASIQVDLMTNMTFGSTVVSSELHDYAGQSRIFQFPHTPLLSVNKVEYNVNGWGLSPSWVQLAEGDDKDYVVYLDLAEFQFVNGINKTLPLIPQTGLKRLRLSYTHGFGSVPLEIERLTTLMVAKRTISTLINYVVSNTVGQVRIGPVMVSDPSNYSTGYLKDLNTEINDLIRDSGHSFKVFKFTRSYDPVNVDRGYNQGGYYG